MVKQTSYIRALYEMHTKMNPYINREQYIYILEAEIYNCNTHSIRALNGNANLHYR